MPSRRIGSIASSGSPPLPQIARTPYFSPSPSVKRTIRAEVVVPMQTFSYLPGPSFRTPGAVCRRKAPLRSIGGSTPSSKIRICVRSRMPMMWPSTSTSSPACSSRIASSVVGQIKRFASELTVVLHFSLGTDVCGRAARGPALVVDGDRIERHVRVRVLDVALEHGDVDVEPVPVRHELPVDDREPVARVRPGVLASDRVDGVRAQRMLDGRALGSGL